MSENKKKVLHVGCGEPNPQKLPEMFRNDAWQEVRLDINEAVKPDIVASMIDMHMVEDNSFDALYSSHNVEHLFRHQVPVALKEFFRVLKPEGKFVVTLPDVQAVSAFIAEGTLDEALYQSPAGPIAPIDILYGWTKSIAEGNHFMAHKTGFTAKTLAKHMLSAGFSNVQVNRRWLDLWAIGYKLSPGDARIKKQAHIVNERMVGPTGKRFPLWYERLLELQSNPENGFDPLDGEPQVWKPLGLKASD